MFRFLKSGNQTKKIKEQGRKNFLLLAFPTQSHAIKGGKLLYTIFQVCKDYIVQSQH